MFSFHGEVFHRRESHKQISMKWTWRGTQTIKKSLTYRLSLACFQYKVKFAIKENIAGKLTHQGENEHKYACNQNESLTYLSLACFHFMVKFATGEKVTNKLA